MQGSSFTAPVLGGSRHGQIYTGPPPFARLIKRQPTPRVPPLYSASTLAAETCELETYKLELFRSGRYVYGRPDERFAWVLVGTSPDEALALAKAHFGPAFFGE